MIAWMRRFAAFGLGLCLTAVWGLAPAFELKDGDRVAWIGNTLIEREQEFGYWELALTARWPERHITFRNFGWSGDTVTGESRKYYGSYRNTEMEQKGLDRLLRHVKQFKPAVMFLGYGANASFQGEEGLPAFLDGYRALLDRLEEAAEARCVLVSPIRHENLGPPYPDPAAHNRDLELYTRAIGRLAGERGCEFVDFFHALGQHTKPSRPLTHNGIHLTAYGYYHAALALEAELGLDPAARRVSADLNSRRSVPEGAALIPYSSPKKVRLSVRWPLLPIPAPEEAPGREAALGGALAVQGLVPGVWRLMANGETLAKHRAALWERGVALRRGPAAARAERLRKVILEKNRLFFHSYRPHNDTYLRGFRKHEQGRNAAEIERFDPLVWKNEEKIRELRVPARRTYVLRRAGEALQ